MCLPSNTKYKRYKTFSQGQYSFKKKEISMNIMRNKRNVHYHCSVPLLLNTYKVHLFTQKLLNHV